MPFSPMCEYVRVCVYICIYVGSYEQGIAATTVQATRNVYRARNPSFFIFFPPRSFFSSFFFFFFFFVVVASRCFSLPTIPKEILSGPPPYKLPVFGAGTGDGESFRSPLCIGFSRKGSVCNIQFDDRESAERRLYTPRYQTILFAETFTPRCHFYSEDSGEPSSRKFNKRTTFVRSSIPSLSSRDSEMIL